MKKRIFAIFLVFAMIFAFVACDFFPQNNNDNDNGNNNDSSPETNDNTEGKNPSDNTESEKNTAGNDVTDESESQVETETQDPYEKAIYDCIYAEEIALSAIISMPELSEAQKEFLQKAAVHDTEYYNRVKEAFSKLVPVIDYKQSKDPNEKALFERENYIYDVVVTFNLDYEVVAAQYDALYAKYEVMLDGKEYSEYRKVTDNVYAMYSKSKIGYEQIDYALAKEIAEIKMDEAMDKLVAGEISTEDFIEQVENYGFALLDTDDLDNAIMYYLTDELDTETLTAVAAALLKNKTSEEHLEAFEKAIAAYLDGTLADTALDDAVDAWFEENAQSAATDADALRSAVTAFVNMEIRKSALVEAISAYAFSRIDKSTVVANIAALKLEKKAYDKAYVNYKLDPIDDNAEYEAAKAAYETAKKAFDDGVVRFKTDLTMATVKIRTFTNLLESFNPEKDIYDEWVAREGIDKTDAESKYNTAKASYDASVKAVVEFCYGDADHSVLDANITDYEAKTLAHNKYRAADDAFTAVLDSGFQVTFEDAYAIYEEYYVNDRYSSYIYIIRAGKASAEDQACFKTFYNSDLAVDALDADVKAMGVKIGHFDNYVVALAEYDYAVENPDKFTDEEMSKVEDFKNQSRRKALASVSSINSGVFFAMEKMYTSINAQIKLAEEGIKYLAEVEEYELEYIQGAEKTLVNITVTDKTPEVVKQAIERAQKAYSIILSEKIDVVDDGRIKTDEVYDGHELYMVTLPNSGNTVYSYGTYETGYQYLAKNDDGTFSVYLNDLSFAGGWVNGIRVYENAQCDFGRNVFFTVDGGRYTYYTKVADGVFIAKDPIVYSGELSMTLDDGTELYLDGETYYSKTETGEYIRYTYSKSVIDIYDEILHWNEKVFDIVESLQNSKETSDNAIYDEILERIEINKNFNED